MARALRRLADEAAELVALFRTRAVTVGTIVLLLLLYLLGLLVPQRIGMTPAEYDGWRTARPRLVAALEATGLIDVYTSPLMYVALGFFFASLVAVLLDRVPRAVRATRLSHGIPLDAAAIRRRRGVLALEAGDGEGAIERAAGFLAARGYAIWRAPGGLRAVRFRFAPIGFFVFHGSFGLLLAGGVLLSLTRFSARVEVAEGEAFDAAAGPYEVRPRFPRVGPRYPDASFTILAVRPQEERGTPTGLEVDYLAAGDLQPKTARVNEPAPIGDASVLVMDVGAAPLLTCDVDGAEVDGAWVKLERGTITRAVLAGCGLELLARDAGAPGASLPVPGGQMIRSQLAGHRSSLPDGLQVSLRGPDGDAVEAVLTPGRSLSTRDGKRRLTLREVRRYAALLIVAERGGGLLWAGFITAIAGLVVRLVLYRREIVVVASGDELLIAGVQDAAAPGRQEALMRALVEALSRTGASDTKVPSAKGG